MNNILMTGLLVVIVALGVWYFMAEHYDERERKLIKHYADVEAENQKLKDERRVLDKEISQLAHSFERYEDTLEGDTPELEVVL